MKKLFFALVMVVGLVAAAPLYAQDHAKSTPEERATKLTEWMKTNLALTPEQEAKVKDINLKFAQKNGLLKEGTDSKEDKMKAMKVNEEARDTELKGILNEDQFKTYQAKKADMKGKMKEKQQ